QQSIGKEEEEFTGSLFCPREGEVAASILMRRELLQGTSYRIEPVFNPVWDEQLRHWGRTLGGLGAINFQFRLLDNQPVCFEINARFSGTTSVRALLGYNDVAMAVRAFVLGEEVGQPTLLHRRVLRYWQEMVVEWEQPLAGASP
ncbi:MAG: carbamoyl phosphate synthase, partial [Magnetococcales bacterium]|nr:ATP-grasp domain-containing protein [Magnetococcales bacterium]NGZ28675.1 carbamoyl phosphate synthase [Magnetococcales bacterium]